MRSAFAFDLGEWFHDPVLAGHVSPRHWRRLASCSSQAFALARALAAQGPAKVTWFVTAELAVREGWALRKLADAGHEIALAATPLALAADAGGDERERAQRDWLAALAAIEGATGVAVRGVHVPWPTVAAAWWHAWFAEAGLGYVASPARAGDREHTVRSLSDGRTFAATVVAAWAMFVPGRPRLVGLPRAVFAAHYGRQAPDGPPVVSPLHDGAIALADAFPIAARPQPPRAVPAPADVARGAGAQRLAVVVPLKDEEAGIASLATELREVERALADVAACEFVFVDDGSVDRTWPLLQEHFAALPGVVLVRHEHNRGVAAAIRTGIAATTADLVASIDGDLSYDPMELRAMLALAAHADVVTASPYHPRGGVRNVPGWRLVLSRTLSGAYRVLLRSPVRTWTSCFRVYRRAAVVDLPLANPGFLGTAELLVRVLRRGGVVAEHPCVLEARLFGVSKMRVLRTILGHLRLLAAVLLRRVR